MSDVGKLFLMMGDIGYWPHTSDTPIIHLLRETGQYALDCGTWRTPLGTEYLLLLFGEQVFRTWLCRGTTLTRSLLKRI